EAYRQCLFFFFKKESLVQLPADTKPKWFEAVRPLIKNQLATAHAHALSPAALQDIIKGTMPRTTEPTAPCPESADSQVKASILEEHRRVLAMTDTSAAIKAWSDDNMDIPLVMAPDFGAAMRDAFAYMKKRGDGDGPLENLHFAMACAEGLRKIRPGTEDYEKECVAASALMADQKTTGCDKQAAGPKEVCDIWACQSQAFAYCTVRADIALSILRTIVVPKFLSPGRDTASAKAAFTSLSAAINAMTEARDKIAAVDINMKLNAGADTAINWVQFWTRCLAAASADNGPTELRKMLDGEITSIATRFDHRVKAEVDRLAAEQQKETGTGGDDAAQQAVNTEGLANIAHSFEEQGKQYMSLSTEVSEESFEIPAAVRCDVMQMIMCRINSKVTEHAMQKGSLKADKGMSELLYDRSGARRTLWCRGMATDGIRIGFTGHVTMVPTVGCFELGEVDHVKVYLKTNLPKSGPIIGHFCPAWLVQPVTINADTGEAARQAKMNLLFDEVEFEFKWSATFLGAEETMNIKLKIPYLELGAEFKKLEHPFELDRTWSDGLETWSLGDREKKYNQAIADTLKALKPSGSATEPVSEEWRRIADHIL
ncbi:unnamed protein product, partial [Prorocentrum cordatum]